MSYLLANWPAPSGIKAISTTRHGGFSQGPYQSNNLGAHVGDNRVAVDQNRDFLRKELGLKNDPIWLNQTHSTEVIVIGQDRHVHADAAISYSRNDVLAIMTADCLPILICDQNKTVIAAIHAGWRGLVAGIVENTLAKMQTSTQDLMAWIGPAICGRCYEVGPEIQEQFIDKYLLSQHYFQLLENRLYVDLAGIAAEILCLSGVNKVYKSEICTFEQKNDFFSYRRDGQTGRIASLIWFDDSPMSA